MRTPYPRTIEKSLLLALLAVVASACQGAPPGVAPSPTAPAGLIVAFRPIDFEQLVFEVTATNGSGTARSIDLTPKALTATDDLGNAYRLYPDPNRDFCDYRPDVVIRRELAAGEQAIGCMIFYGEVPAEATRLTIQMELAGGLGPWDIRR